MSEPATRSGPSRPTVIVGLLVAAMSACVLGLVIWKALDARSVALAQGERDIRNLAHSLAEHASRSIQSADIAMSGIVDLLKYQRPRADRTNLFLRNTVSSLPQIREMGVLDAEGRWIYSSLERTPDYTNADRPYFTYHRDSTDPNLQISDPLQSRLTGRRTLLLTKRISAMDGSFIGVLLAAIDGDYFDAFYDAFKLGPHAGITMLRYDGTVLARWPAGTWNGDARITTAFKAEIERDAAGFYRTKSPFDGYLKYLAFEHASQYPIVMTVALTEDEVLAPWRADLRNDVFVAIILLGGITLLAALLSVQLRARARVQSELREREARYRLLADNIADVVIQLDREGKFIFVSQSVEPVLGLKPTELTGKSCFEFVHPDDMAAVAKATAELTDWNISKTVTFRTWRADKSIVWIEINFKLAGRADDRGQVEVIGAMRDITARKEMEDELNALNALLSQLATTDALTGLANRRSFDAALRREFSRGQPMSVIMIDIDNFKGFNDNLGHQAGDACLKRVAKVIARVTENTAALAARYGGEEFGVILPKSSGLDAMNIAETLREEVLALDIANPASAHGKVSVSLGIAASTAETVDEHQLLGNADAALYEAKRHGRNRCVLSSQIAATASPATQPSMDEMEQKAVSGSPAS